MLTGNGPTLLLILDFIPQNCREADPRLWAVAQNNHGVLLIALAETEIGLSSLTKAQNALARVSRGFDLGRSPFDWANIKTNLGVALMKAGDRQKFASLYEEAAVQFRDALKVVTPDRNPKKWATIQSNLGIALSFAGEAHGNARTLRNAISAIHKSLTALDPVDEPVQWMRTEHALGARIYFIAGAEDGSQSFVRDAVRVLREALAANPRSQHGDEWQGTMNEWALCLLKMSKETMISKSLVEARSILEALLADLTPGQTNRVGVDAVQNLGKTLHTLGALQDDAG